MEDETPGSEMKDFITVSSASSMNISVFDSVLLIPKPMEVSPVAQI